MIRKVHITALAVLVAFTLVSGCATVSDEYNELFATYEGGPVQSAIDDFGRPDKVEDDGMGGKIVYWSVAKENVVMVVRMWTDKDGRLALAVATARVLSIGAGPDVLPEDIIRCRLRNRASGPIGPRSTSGDRIP